MSVRLKMALSYAAFLAVGSGLLLAVVWVFLLRYVPEVIAVPVSGPRKPGSGPGAPLIGIPDRSDLREAFVPKALAAMGFLLFFGVAGGWILAGAMLAPLNRITDATRIAAAGSLTHRVRLEGRADEFRELADAFDAMLARLESSMAEQRRFAANASHELRTPLAVTRALLEVAREEPPRDPGELVERLDHVNARAIDLTEALLLLSRVERWSASRTDLDLSLLVEEAVETLLPLAERSGITVRTNSSATPVVGSASLVLQVVVNLVHNALVHNRPGGEVSVGSRAVDGVAELVVENTGSVIDERLVPVLVEPFQRGAGRIAGKAGVGLGLAIVDRIVSAHDGELALVPRKGGGLVVTVRLPAGPRSP